MIIISCDVGLSAILRSYMIVIQIYYFNYSIISSIMEDLKVGFQPSDTASSDGFTRMFTSTPKAGSATPLKMPSQKTQQQNIQSLILKIKECIESNTVLFQKIHYNEELKTYLAETLQELAILKASVDGKMSITRDQFQLQMNQLQRLVLSIKKQWKQFKEKQEKIITTEIQLLKQEKLESQTAVTKIFKEGSLEIKCKFAKFGKQLKDFKRDRADRKNVFFRQIERVRLALDQNIQFQRKKRCEYEQIVLKLLQKTCDQGQRILRRIC